VQRGMQVLRAFRSDRKPLSNAEIVRRTGLSKATVSRLTSTLMQLGFLRHVPEGRAFELGTAALGIGHAYIVGSELAAIANPLLQDLADTLGMSIALSTRDGLDMLYLAYKTSDQVATLRMGVGTVLPMAVTAGGHAYLWGLAAEQREPMIAEILRLTADPPRIRRILQSSFSELDSSGFCAVFGEYQRGVYAVAMPVSVGRERIVMGLSCGRVHLSPDCAAERRRIAPVLRNAAAQLEKALANLSQRP
jgi:IclR family transcriptional regulator, positive regulator for flagellar biogenesis